MSVSSNTRVKKSKDNSVLKPNIIGEVKFNLTIKKAKPDKKSNNKRINMPMEETNAEASGSKINSQIVILTNEKIVEDNVNTNIEVMEEIESGNNELQEDIKTTTSLNGAVTSTQKNIKSGPTQEKIMGKNISEKVEKVRKILKKETAVVLVKTEVFKDNRMISALYDNEEEMEKGKRNSVKELMHGVKLWDVPLRMKNKELKEDLENKYVAIFKEKEDAKKVMEKWSIIIGEDSLRVTQIDQTADNLKSRGEHVTRIIGLPNGITAQEEQEINNNKTPDKSNKTIPMEKILSTMNSMISRMESLEIS
ncbi:4562_t:CDS:2 [Diversispora eburnea]|uniref:4562_t:CDS:1 n=1 Tax=Diversispora eburnea TaxID=1213867 RepID=A0A9N9GS95_9GLOM|nr:4562_t:CDS:2 [Diversispora eburnea]